MDVPWQAEWITPAWLDRTVHPLLRRDLPPTVKSPVPGCRSAAWVCMRPKSTAKGSVTSIWPFCNAYDHWIQYQTYDVTDLLQAGDNTIGVRLGNGWYKGRFGFDNYGEELYGDRFALLSELVVTLADGRQMVFGSDDQWRATAGPVIDSNIYDGEIRDARRQPAGWSSLDSMTWPGKACVHWISDLTGCRHAAACESGSWRRFNPPA